MEKWLVPNWQRELLSFKGIKSTFILEGNINDIYPIFKKEDDDITLERFASMEQLIISLSTPVLQKGITNTFSAILFSALLTPHRQTAPQRSSVLSKLLLNNKIVKSMN